MTKLARDARAFAKRVQMSSTKFWLVVEGKVNDRPYYERLLASHRDVAEGGYAIRLAEEIELNGTSAGGKTHLRALYSTYKSEGSLKLANSETVNCIAFALDRDFDALAGTLEDSPHLIYTHSMDVESEILLNGDLLRAVSSTFSISQADIDPSLKDARAVAMRLANLWRDWIVAGACCCLAGVPSEVRTSKRSKINGGGFDQVDVDKRDSLVADIEARCEENGRASQYDEAVDRVNRFFEAEKAWRLIKGRWLQSYIAHLLDVQSWQGPREKNVHYSVLAKTSLETLDFTGAWADHYRRRFDLILAA